MLLLSWQARRFFSPLQGRLKSLYRRSWFKLVKADSRSWGIVLFPESIVGQEVYQQREQCSVLSRFITQQWLNRRDPIARGSELGTLRGGGTDEQTGIYRRASRVGTDWQAGIYRAPSRDVPTSRPGLGKLSGQEHKGISGLL